VKPSTSARIAIKGSAFLSDRRLLYGFKLALTLALLVWLWHYLRPHDFFSVWNNLDSKWAALAFVLVPANIFLQFRKWQLLLRCAQPHCPAGVALYSLFAGFPLGLLTPGRWGELARALYVPSLPKEQVFMLSALDKIHTLLVNALLGSCALLYFIEKKLLPDKWQTLAVLTLAVFLFLNVTLLVPGFFRRGLDLPRRLGFKKFALDASALQIATQKLFALYLLSFLFVATYCVQMAVLVRGLAAIDLLPALAGAAAIFFLKSALPITVGELGIREGLAIFFLGRLHVPAAAAIHASLVLFVCNLVLPALAGLLWTWKRKNEDMI